MKSLSRIVKAPEEEQKVQPYNFFAGFTIKKDDPEKEQEEYEDAEEQEEDEEEELISPHEVIEQAKQQAEKILSEARKQADILRDEAFAQGEEEGRELGIQKACEERQEAIEQELNALRKQIAEIVQSVSVEKEKLIEESVDNLKRISITVAEKIIQTSLQSSGDIIKRMILAATDKMKKKQWAKIYVTKCSTDIAMEVDTEFLEALSHLSDNIKIITMDNGEDGTCIIELPDEIVDASVGTQLENIKDIINNAKM